MIDLPLAKFVAENAINAPFRQVRVQNTPEFQSWLGAAGIRLPASSIVHLWKSGLVRPIAISMPAEELFGESRFVPFTQSADLRPQGVPWSVDLGRVVTANEVMIERYVEDRTHVHHLWWHRFQVWEFERLSRILESHIGLTQALYGAEASAKHAERMYGDIPSRIADWANSSERETWEKVLGLLLYAEPLVHLWYDSKVRFAGWRDADLGAYFDWLKREGAHAASALERVGLTLEETKRWHEKLNTSAVLIDPVSQFRTLLRYAARDSKSRLKDEALRADALYEAAEVLRRYLETYHDVRLPEETGTLMMTTDDTLNQMLYGGSRLLDFDRKVFRRIIRRYGLDPQARLTWLVEGDTEVGVAVRLAERYGTTLEHVGIDVMNFHGLGGLDSDRTISLLERLKNEEVFVYVSVDRDTQGGDDHMRQLRQYAQRDLLVGFQAWEPDFEDCNFTRGELAQIATKMAQDQEIDLLISEDDLEAEVHRNRKHVPVGGAIERLLRRHGCRLWKTAAGGRYLADWVMDVPCPREKAVEGKRPILELYLYLQRSQTSDYWQTVQRSHVGDDGLLHPRELGRS